MNASDVTQRCRGEHECDVSVGMCHNKTPTQVGQSGHLFSVQDMTTFLVYII